MEAGQHKAIGTRTWLDRRQKHEKVGEGKVKRIVWKQGGYRACEMVTTPVGAGERTGAQNEMKRFI